MNQPTAAPSALNNFHLCKGRKCSGDKIVTAITIIIAREATGNHIQMAQSMVHVWLAGWLAGKETSLLFTFPQRIFRFWSALLSPEFPVSYIIHGDRPSVRPSVRCWCCFEIMISAFLFWWCDKNNIELFLKTITNRYKSDDITAEYFIISIEINVIALRIDNFLECYKFIVTKIFALRVKKNSNFWLINMSFVFPKCDRRNLRFTAAVEAKINNAT